MNEKHKLVAIILCFALFMCISSSAFAEGETDSVPQSVPSVLADTSDASGVSSMVSPDSSDITNSGISPDDESSLASVDTEETPPLLRYIGGFSVTEFLLLLIACILLFMVVLKIFGL